MASLRTLLYCVLFAACSDPARLDVKDLTVVHQYVLDGKGTAYKIVIGGDVAYVSDQAGFRSFRLTDTDATPLATYVFEPQSAQSNQPLALRGNLLAVAHGARISLVDVTDPAAPVTLSTIDAGSDGTAHGLVFDGDYVYWTGINIKRASIADPRNPGTPQVIAAQSFNTLLIHDGYIYASSAGNLVVFKLPDPNVVNGVAPPVAMTSLTQAWSLLLNGTALYGTSGTTGRFFVVDVADPMAPKVTVDNPAGGFEVAGALALRGEQLLAPAYNGVIYDYDVSDPLHPVDAGSTIPRGFDNFPNYGAARRGDLVLLGNEKGLLVLYPTLRE